mgnify:CR=1 FL=1
MSGPRERFQAPRPRSEAATNSTAYQHRQYLIDVRLVRRLFEIEHNDAELIGIKVPGRSLDWIRDVISYREGGTVE